MNPEKLKKMQAEVRIGGKGTPRRKKKVVRPSTAAFEAQEKTQLQKIGLRPLSDVGEVTFFMNDMTIMQFKRPEVQMCVPPHTAAIKGVSEVKQLSELGPQCLYEAGLLRKPFEVMGYEMPGGADIVDDFDNYCMTAAYVKKGQEKNNGNESD